jgi:hypothetical protein
MHLNEKLYIHPVREVFSLKSKLARKGRIISYMSCLLVTTFNSVLVGALKVLATCIARYSYSSKGGPPRRPLGEPAPKLIT